MSANDIIVPNKNVSKNKLQELNDLFMLLKDEKLKFIETDIFLDTVLESAVSSYGVNQNLELKIRDIILRGELVNVLHMRDDISNTEISLLNLDDFNNIELSFEEQKNIKAALEKRIKEKDDTFLKDMTALTDCDTQSLQEVINYVKFDTEAEKNKLIFLQSQLTEQQKLLVSAMHSLGKKLQEFVNIKTQIAPEIAKRKTIEINTESQKFNLRYRIINQQLRLAIFEELPISMDVYRKALQDLKDQQDELSKEIEKTRMDIESYKIISKHDEYLEILKNYKQYKKSLENKLWIYNELLKNRS